MNPRTHPLRAVLLVSFAAFLFLAGCGTSGGSSGADETTTTAEETTTTVAEDDGADDDDAGVTYEVGQCFDPDDAGATSDAIVDCQEEHRYEVVGIIDSPFAVVPEDADAQMKVACSEVLDEYLGGDGVGAGIQVTNLTASGDVGDAVEGTDDELVVCIGEAPTGLKLTESIAGGAAEALEPYVAVMSLDPGDCFVLYEDFFYVGTPAACGDAEALVNLGTFEVSGDDYPGDDELKALRDDRCAGFAEDLDLPNADEASGTVPSEDDWLVGVRVITCDVPAATR